MRRIAAQSSAASIVQSDSGSVVKDPITPSQSRLVDDSPRWKKAPPFIPAIDFPRAVLFVFQAFVGYLLMLAVMSYSAWFFIAVLLGFGVGELSVGRFMSGHESHGVHM